MIIISEDTDTDYNEAAAIHSEEPEFHVFEEDNVQVQGDKIETAQMENTSNKSARESCDNDKVDDDLYTALITKAPYVPGDVSPLVPLDEIPWIDKSLIEHSISFHKKHLTQLILANTAALMFGFAVKPNSTVILRTGKLHNPELSFHRYLSTIQRIGKFFLFTIDEAKAFKAFDTVRKMHALASKKKMESASPSSVTETLDLAQNWKKELAHAMQADLKHIDTSAAPKDILTWDPAVPVSQFDMVITQFGFIGTMWLFPRVFGIKDRYEEMKGVIHVWAIYGRLLGIKDEFSICIKPDAQLYDKLFQNIVVESLKTMDETVVTIQSAFMEAFTKRIPFMTYKSMLYTGLQELEGYEGDNLWNLMSYWDKISVKILQLWMWSMRKSSIVRFCMNISTAMWIQFQFWMHLPTSLWE
ncbi:unnamed protein product [Orchesella dallaii]|uniref:ER-bound oxygenase mpaB/mpaB'/Rubber oxygenase catalytic domain-containing protein n=1 Tax=Orchesella dallaii TaxID=48710 RepID=A0ABP1S2J9_9HEXA